ncbi:MAG TPA: YfcE family phosphodiesterase [Bacteroidia bacterium]|nr:YfcE family phosphodiesterase [Bacteroidia bacterium]
MKALIISDIHDHIQNLESALNLAKTSGCHAVICCGDLCAPFVIDVFHRNTNLPVHIVFGNNDGDRITIQAKTIHANESRQTGNKIHIHGEFLITNKTQNYEGIPHDISLAVYHYPIMASLLADSDNFDYVFYGHSHSSSLETKNRTILANPGSIMGYIPGPDPKKVHPTCLIVNWASREIELIEL